MAANTEGLSNPGQQSHSTAPLLAMNAAVRQSPTMA
jgi:hypothetical protein